jgi:electron transport complex protein RnfB
VAGSIAAAAISMGALGVAFAGGLYYAAKKLQVDTDERIELLTNILPGYNCGACGFSGCSGLAQALLEGKASANACSPGGAEVAARVADALEMTVTPVKRKVAHVACRGNLSFDPRADYEGLQDCRAAHMVVGGHRTCVYGCLGFGTCVQACQFGALTQDERGVPIVDTAACVGCGECAEVCPRGVIRLVEDGKHSFVRCNSPLEGRTARTVCQEGCIGCRACERVCHYEAVHVIDGLAVIDASKCTGCGECAVKCPTKCIKPAGAAFVVEGTA